MRRSRYFILLLVVSSLIVSSAMPAFAISSIFNFFSASDYSINTNQTVYFTAKTTYDYVYIANPYSSNFVTELSAYHFNRPSTYQAVGLSSPNNWIYYSTGIFVSPCYRLYEHWWLIIPPVTKYVKFQAVAKSAPAGSRRGSRHGQSRELDLDVSYGDPAWIYTTHN